MAIAANVPGAGIDRRTGRLLSGWPHVQQSLEVIFTTGFGERVMREWFGSHVPRLLGESLTTPTLLRFKLAVFVAIELWEPRFRVTKINSLSVDRLGRYRCEIEGEWRPRGHLEDYRVDGARRVITVGQGAR